MASKWNAVFRPLVRSSQRKIFDAEGIREQAPEARWAGDTAFAGQALADCTQPSPCRAQERRTPIRREANLISNAPNRSSALLLHGCGSMARARGFARRLHALADISKAVCALTPHPPQSKTLRARGNQSLGSCSEFRQEPESFQGPPGPPEGADCEFAKAGQAVLVSPMNLQPLP